MCFLSLAKIECDLSQASIDTLGQGCNIVRFVRYASDAHDWRTELHEYARSWFPLSLECESDRDDGDARQSPLDSGHERHPGKAGLQRGERGITVALALWEEEDNTACLQRVENGCKSVSIPGGVEHTAARRYGIACPAKRNNSYRANQ